MARKLSRSDGKGRSYLYTRKMCHDHYLVPTETITKSIVLEYGDLTLLYLMVYPLV